MKNFKNDNSCDPFKEGDRVWADGFGFGTITDYIPEQSAVRCEFDIDANLFIHIHPTGEMFGFSNRPRTFFHAVADTDGGMRLVIARGGGLKRPVSRGRWPIQEGDVVICFSDGDTYICKAISYDNEFFSLEVEFFGYYFSQYGHFGKDDEYPSFMRLYDGEEPFKTSCENIRWIMDEAVKENWYEKYAQKRSDKFKASV